MGLEGIDVAPCSRTRERCCCTQVPHVIETRLRQGQERLHGNTRLGCQAFNLSKQCDQVVGADRGSCVVKHAVIIGYFETSTGKHIDELTGEWIARNGKPAAASKALGSNVDIGQRHQWMDRAATLVGSKRIETGGPRTVQDHRFGWLNAGRGLGDGPIRSRDQHRVHTLSGRTDIGVAIE